MMKFAPIYEWIGENKRLSLFILVVVVGAIALYARMQSLPGEFDEFVDWQIERNTNLYTNDGLLGEQFRMEREYSRQEVNMIRRDFNRAVRSINEVVSIMKHKFGVKGIQFVDTVEPIDIDRQSAGDLKKESAEEMKDSAPKPSWFSQSADWLKGLISL